MSSFYTRLMAPVLTTVTDRVHFVYTDLVNWTVVTGSQEDGGGAMLIDAGYPGSRTDVLDSLSQLGFGAQDVHAILLTHAHIDHFGSAIWFAREHGTPVYCHADEVGHSKREYLEQVSPLDLAGQLWKPNWLKWSASIIGKGALTREGIPSTAPLTEDIAAQLPGAPKSIPTPGHTGGHCSYLVDGILVGGDALITDHPLAPRRGPQLPPSMFNHDDQLCRRSLDALALLQAEVLLPGHGPVWRGSVREATGQAAQASLS